MKMYRVFINFQSLVFMRSVFSLVYRLDGIVCEGQSRVRLNFRFNMDS